MKFQIGTSNFKKFFEIIKSLNGKKKMNLEKIKNAYFIGIGGIGMSALARYFKMKGKKVWGYDKTKTYLTDQLNSEGIEVHYEEDISFFKSEIQNLKSEILVIYTPAISQENLELKFFKENKFLLVKRSDVLEEITKDFFTIAVAGTHGKTTISSMIAYILKHSGFDCTAFLGGILLNYNSNFISGKNKTMVVEADEYDRSFLKLSPNISVVTATDADHLDIYGTVENMQKAFIEFTEKTKSDGVLILKSQIPIREKVERKFLTYSLNDKNSDFYSENFRILDGKYIFDVHTPNEIFSNVELNIGGRHNVENVVAAIAAAQQLKIENEKIKKAVADFKGVQRRFEYKIKSDSLIFIDDYAHHPQEIKSLLYSVKELYPEKKITAVFQPHLFSRTKDLAIEFAESLNLADEIILMDIYPARELPMQGVTSKIIFDRLTVKEKFICSKDDLLTMLSNRETEVLLTIGAGDIDQCVEPIKNLFLN